MNLWIMFSYIIKESETIKIVNFKYISLQNCLSLLTNTRDIFHPSSVSLLLTVRMTDILRAYLRFSARGLPTFQLRPIPFPRTRENMTRMLNIENDHHSQHQQRIKNIQIKFMSQQIPRIPLNILDSPKNRSHQDETTSGVQGIE